MSRAKSELFLTRTRGTPDQIGKKFPVVVRRRRKPSLLYKVTSIEKAWPKTQLGEMSLREEKRLLAAGFKGWMISVRYKDGTIEHIPMIARNYTEALKQARPKMNQIASQVDEIVIVDPGLGEILHKIGAGAVRVAKAIGRGAVKAAKVGYKLARKGVSLGRQVAAEVRQVKEQRAAAAEGRAFTGESPLTVTKAEELAEKIVEEGEGIPEGVPAQVIRARGRMRIIIEVE